MPQNLRCKWIKTERGMEVEIHLEDGSYFILTAVEAKKRYGLKATEKSAPSS